ncbi:MAG TPA: hypothetical protein VGH64_01600 [Puia sp.]
MHLNKYIKYKLTAGIKYSLAWGVAFNLFAAIAQAGENIYAEVKNQNHFASTGKEPVTVEITGYGPSGVTYVDPGDDPQKKQ